MIFDVDGTREALLQRELPQVDGRPAKRRRQRATAPGYTGRKRAERIMTRMVVQQSHTQEFLGSLPMAGNGHRAPMMHWAAQQIAHYAKAREMPLDCCIVRSDGEHGVYSQVLPVTQHGLGFISRCADYRLLDSPVVKATLAAGTTVRITHPDSGMVREVFDVPAVQWPSINDEMPEVRVIVTRSHFPAEKRQRIGHRIGNDVFELFVTSRPASSLHAADVVALYLHRGQFEAALAQEETELPTSHWASDHLEGQQLWHLLAQWVWNIRIWLGAELLRDDELLRRTDFTPSVETLSTPLMLDLDALHRAAAATNSAPSAPQTDAAPKPTTESPSARDAATPTPTRPDGRGQVAPNTLRFARDPSGAVHCPAGHRMSLSERRKRFKETRERHEVARGHCRSCLQRDACRGPGVSIKRGRRIEIGEKEQEIHLDADGGASRKRLRVLPPETPTDSRTSEHRAPLPAARTEPPTRPSLLQWQDVAATQARKALHRALVSLRAEMVLRTKAEPPTQAPTPLVSRDRRAHRRRTTQEHQQRNAADSSKCWTIRFGGVPPSLAKLLEIATIP
jgi:hypothetical protein